MMRSAKNPVSSGGEGQGEEASDDIPVMINYLMPLTGRPAATFGRPISECYLNHFLSIIYANLLSKLVEGFIEGQKGNIR